MTIGDVLGAIAAIVLLAASWGATLLITVLAFTTRVARAQRLIESAPGRCFLLGLGIFVAFGFAAVLLGQAPGPFKLIAFSVWVGLFVVSTLGASGIVRLIGERIEHAGTQMPPFAALTRGSALFVTACLLPIVGWFFVLPVAALIGLGSGAKVLRALKTETVSAPADTSATATATAAMWTLG